MHLFSCHKEAQKLCQTWKTEVMQIHSSGMNAFPHKNFFRQTFCCHGFSSAFVTPEHGTDRRREALCHINEDR